MAKPTALDDAPSNGHRARLRQRFLKVGLDGFSDVETLELLLCLAIPRRDVKPQARALLSKYGSLRACLDADAQELAALPGMGEGAAAGLKLVRDAAGLYLRQKAEARVSWTEFSVMADYWRLQLGGLRHEEFHVAYLDSSHQVLPGGFEALEAGLPDQAAVYPRKVMGEALRRGAVALVVAHNHPSGACEPSMQDKQLTRALQDAARTLQMRLLDHLIVAGDRVFSFRREGLL